MTIDLTREEMLERIIEEQYDSMDYKTLWRFFEYYTQREYNDISTEEIEDEYKNLFDDEE
jgi:hypothetical protein